MGRSLSTVSREVHRSRTVTALFFPMAVGTTGRTPPNAAPTQAGKIGQSPGLRDSIQHHLTMRWSPERICHALDRLFPDRPELHVTATTRASYDDTLA
ncbi:hypothetical protein GCM10009727_16500 [Actinomadura napierensis]|uniref:Uncharacterized protein n=2 Tax=Actinomadura napierensis TaxID=267854 RepID=A0ABN2YHT2_9ACTN